MFRLNIKRADGSLYWTQDFNTLKHGEDWLAEESTRPYWDATYTHEFLDITHKESDQDRNDRLTKEAVRQARKGARKQLDWSKINTVAELKAVVKNLVDSLED